MRRFASYVMAVGLAAAAITLVTLLSGVPVGARSTVERSSALQSVNRALKGDRLTVPTAIERSQAPRWLPTLPVGCEPAMSLLSASAQVNVPSRCVA